MSAPVEVTPRNLSGKWALNKSLSDNTEAQLSLQGISWITRKTLSKASIALSISQYTDTQGVPHFDTEQRTLGRTVDQKNVLDGKAAEVSHPLFGQISVSQFWAPVEAIDEPYLREALEEGTDGVVELKIVNDEAGWTSTQICAIENVNGERRHTRRSVVTNGDEVVKCRLVYDWEGAN